MTPTAPQPHAPESLATKYLAFCKQHNLKPCFYSSIRAYRNLITN